jgi:transposase-like protein
MVEVKCSKCGNTFEGKTEEKAKKKLMKHAKKHHSN